MKHEYKPRFYVPLQAGITYTRPQPAADYVHLDNPAIDVMTDFRDVVPRTTKPSVPIDDALEAMKQKGVRSLLVTGENDDIIGVVTAQDIQGEKPIKLSEETRIAHAAITVEHVMTPQSELSVLKMISVEEAQVGHIVETLRELKRQHLLVVDVNEATGEQCIRGMFSTSQIDKQMHKDPDDEIASAESLAEVVQTMG